MQDNIPSGGGGFTKLSNLDDLIWDSAPPAADMATAANANTAAQGAVLFNDLMRVSKSALVFNEAGFSVANKALVFNEAGLTAMNANSICDHANLTSDHEQAILQQMSADQSVSKLIDIITDGLSVVTISADTQIEDTTAYKDLTVDSGYTLTVHTASDSKSGIIIARTITNNGTITRTPQGAAGGAACASGAGAGAKGGAGLLIVVKTLDNNATISAPGLAGGNAGAYTAECSGPAGSNGALYRVGTDIIGLGGNGYGGGDYTYSGSGGGANAGNGGHTTWGPGGDAGTATYTTKTGAELHDLLLQATIDYFIETIQGKAAPTTPISFPDIYNSGSGGGGSTSEGTSGGGGGGAGEIIVACDSHDNTGGIISADAGKGGNGGTTDNNNDNGGGGGGGGIVYILYKTQTATGTLSAALGAGGNAGSAGHGGSAGNAGTTSAIDITS